MYPYYLLVGVSRTPTNRVLLLIELLLLNSDLRYIPFLFHATIGKYVCVLQDNNYAQNHVIAIDCESSPKLIWDCAETNALRLSQENLNRCAGQGLVCIAIKCIGELKQK